MTVVIGITALESRLNAISGPGMGKALMARVSLRTLTAMKHRIARKTSTTSRSLHVGRVTAKDAEVLGTMNALWIDQGTKAHVIRPKRKKALRWAATGAGRRLSGRVRVAAQRGELGGVRFAQVVHHPGTKPQPYISASVKEALGKSGLSEAVTERWNSGA